jgi:hypothetical protein
MKRLKPLVKAFDGRVAKQLPKEADAELLTEEHKQWRLYVCRRAGWRCEWLIDGLRCRKASPEHRMVADHIVDREDGGALFDPANGQCLCVQHNTIKGIRSRALRAAGAGGA